MRLLTICSALPNRFTCSPPNNKRPTEEKKIYISENTDSHEYIGLSTVFMALSCCDITEEREEKKGETTQRDTIKSDVIACIIDEFRWSSCVHARKQYHTSNTQKNTVLLLGIGNEHKVGERKEFMWIPLPFLFTESIFDVFALFDVAHKAEKTKTKNK